MQNRTVSVNIRGTQKRMQNLPLDTFLKICKKMNEEYSLNLIDEVPADLQ